MRASLLDDLSTAKEARTAEGSAPGGHVSSEGWRDCHTGRGIHAGTEADAKITLWTRTETGF